MDVYFEVLGCLGRRIRVSKNHWDLIVQQKHLEVAGLEKEVQAALLDADVVRISQADPNVYLYYRRFGQYHVCVVCRHLNGEGFVVTCYLTNKIKEGKQIWRR